MKVNAYISSRIKNKLTVPSFSIVQSDIPFASYYEVYGQLYLPIPKPVFPVGATLEFCVGKEEEGGFADNNGVPFKIEIDDPDFVVDANTWVQVFVSGDKLWREDTLVYLRYLVEDPLGYAGRYDTADPYLVFIWAETPGMTILERVRYLNSERFWRCRLVKESGGETYYSAMSEIVSFNVNFRNAEYIEGSNTEKMYPDNSEVLNERGLWFDGNFYYGGTA
jgi:hypothetical protein